jgi:AAA15 family ATPase/GTPase
MITKLKLNSFKNFRQAEINFGPVSLLVGTNATGKSNVRDAFRFLHGIARGYTLAEITQG